MTAKAIDRIDAQIEAAKVELRRLERERSAARRRQRVKCTPNVYGSGCGALLVVSKLVCIQTWWYRMQTSREDAGWRHNEKQFDCPKCGHRNRLYDRPEFNDGQLFDITVHSKDEKGHPPAIDTKDLEMLEQRRKVMAA